MGIQLETQEHLLRALLAMKLRERARQIQKSKNLWIWQKPHPETYMDQALSELKDDLALIGGWIGARWYP